MADLNYIDRTAEVKIVGQDSTGNRVNYVGADVDGNLQTKDYSTGATGAAVPTDAIAIGGKDPSGNLRNVSVDANGNLIATDSLVSLSSASSVFTAQCPSINIGTAETAFYLLRNPIGSGKNLYVFRLTFIGVGTFRLYYLPTVTANGTAVTALNRKITSGAQGNVGLATTQPTVTANGSLADVIGVNAQTPPGSPLDFPPTIIITPGNSLLVTAAMGGNNTPTQVNAHWYEM